MPNEIEKAHIKYSSLTDTIYVARMDAKGDCALNKVDRTNDFIAALLQWCDPGMTREISDGEKVIAVVKVEKP